MLSLSYQPAVGRLTVIVMKAKDLKAKDITGASGIDIISHYFIYSKFRCFCNTLLLLLQRLWMKWIGFTKMKACTLHFDSFKYLHVAFPRISTVLLKFGDHWITIAMIKENKNFWIFSINDLFYSWICVPVLNRYINSGPQISIFWMCVKLSSMK